MQENKFKNTDVAILKQGTQIILPKEPKEMTTDEAIDVLYRKKEEEETTIAINEVVDTFPLDGAHALMKALKQIYGWANAVPKPGFFGPKPPVTVSLEVSYKQFTQVIWGQFQVPGIEGRLETMADWRDGKPQFIIGGTVKKKYQGEVKKIADLTRDIALRESVYRGKAIRLKTDEDGELNLQEAPSFIDTTRVNEEELVFGRELMSQVTTNLFTPIEKTESCRKLKIPLKRGILLEGPYGTGKTLTAFVTAKKCEANGWTFIMLDRVAGLKHALTFARMYAPAVVFAEDIDRAVTGDRSVAMDDILNTIDGVESKGSETITILTSNHAENINRAMLRPGRLDAILSIQPPTAEAAEKLMRLYGRGLIDASTDLKAAAQELAGQIPAVIREVVERSKLYAISRLENGNTHFSLQGEDLFESARGMKHHLQLLNPVKDLPKTATEQLGEAFAKVVKQTVEEMETDVGNIDGTVDRIAQKFGVA